MNPLSITRRLAWLAGLCSVLASGPAAAQQTIQYLVPL